MGQRLMCRKIRVDFIYKIVFAIFLSGGLLLLPVISFAQGDLPCDDGDPLAAPCETPLDTYVWLLAIAGLIFGAVYLYRRQKVQSRA